MKIQGRKSSAIQQLSPLGAPPAAEPAEAPMEASAADQVDLSMTQQLRQLCESVQAMPAVRTEKVEGLRDAIEEGSYYVESDKLARKVVNETLTEALLQQLEGKDKSDRFGDFSFSPVICPAHEPPPGDAMLNKSYLALISLLEQEEVIYGELAAVLAEEREALLAMKAGALAELAARKETLALRIKALDESRKVLANRLGGALGLKPEEVTIARLSQGAPALVSERLSRIGLKLRQAVEQCQSINAFNARAARRGMALVGDAVQYLIEQADPSGKLYHAPRGKGYGVARRHAGTSGFISRQV